MLPTKYCAPAYNSWSFRSTAGNGLRDFCSNLDSSIRNSMASGDSKRMSKSIYRLSRVLALSEHLSDILLESPETRWLQAIPKECRKGARIALIPATADRSISGSPAVICKKLPGRPRHAQLFRTGSGRHRAEPTRHCFQEAM